MPDLVLSQARAVRRLGAAVATYLSTVAVLLPSLLHLHGAVPSAGTAVVCALGPLLGLLLWRRPLADARSRVAGIVAALLFVPVLQMFWVSSQPPQPAGLGWSLGALGLLHAFAVVGFIVWAARVATGVDAAPGRAAVPLSALRERVLRLGEAPGALRVERADAASVVVALDEAPGRVHRVELCFDVQRRCARVRERLSADRAAPRDASEASMRRPGDPRLDASRPDAQRVSGKTWQATLIDPRRLEALQRRVDAEPGAPGRGANERLDGEGLVTLLCALVTTAGWHWRPELA